MRTKYNKNIQMISRNATGYILAVEQDVPIKAHIPFS